MEKYDYYKEVAEDVRSYIESEVDLSEYSTRDEAEEKLNDLLWTVDSVTGNGSGSYTFSTYKAEEYICHNLDLLGEAIEAFGSDMDVLKNGAEACDVTIRCYLLGQTISQVLDDLWVDPEEDDEEDFD